jgi:hypothetical protein
MNHNVRLAVGRGYRLVKSVLPPLLWNLLIFIWRKALNKPTDVGFEGWGMTTEITDPPWVVIAENDTEYGPFLAIQAQIESLLQSGDFIWESNRSITFSRSLMWRHYFVCWSAQYALNNDDVADFVECGVGDGFTSFFALKTIELNSSKNVKAYLYDAWGPMRKEGVIPGESAMPGKYAHLDLKRAQNNLSSCNVSKAFNPGYIPDSFLDAENPETVSWIHIDLNALNPTLEALEFFYEKLIRGGVILFDDYGGSNYRQTKIGIDDFCSDKYGRLLALPTGQAMFFKD